MKVILVKDVPSQGKAGEMINVSDGYAVNYLIKNKLAVEATPARIAELKQKQEALERKKAEEKAYWQAQAKILSQTTVTIKVKCGAEGKIFGSVQSANIADALKEQGIELDKKKIALPEPIKSIGSYVVEARPYPEITAKFKVEIVGE